MKRIYLAYLFYLSRWANFKTTLNSDTYSVRTIFFGREGRGPLTAAKDIENQDQYEEEIAILDLLTGTSRQRNIETLKEHQNF